MAEEKSYQEQLEEYQYRDDEGGGWGLYTVGDSADSEQAAIDKEISKRKLRAAMRGHGGPKWGTTAYEELTPEEEAELRLQGRKDAESEALKAAGIDDPYMYQYMEKLREKAMGRGDAPEWETALRRQLGEGVRGMYRDVQTGGGDRMAARAQISQALTTQGARFEEQVAKRREQERLQYVERFEKARYAARKEGQAAVQADMLLEQELERQREQEQAGMVTGILSFIGGAIGFAATGFTNPLGFVAGSAIGGGVGKIVS